MDTDAELDNGLSQVTTILADSHNVADGMTLSLIPKAGETKQEEDSKSFHGTWTPGLVRFTLSSLVRADWVKYAPFIECSEPEYEQRMAAHATSRVYIIL